MTGNSRDTTNLSRLSTHWHNRSISNISTTSDAATFHSALATPVNMELHPLSQPSPLSPSQVPQYQPKQSPRLEAMKMSRQDSGYSDNDHSASSSRRTSISSRHASSNTSKSRTTTSSSNSVRPSTQRTHRSTLSQTASIQARNSLSGRRPSLSQRHTSPQYQFYQFPTLPEPAPEIDLEVVTPPPPPVTVQYWTSDSTRRLEYAAIDAAGSGVKGFFIKLVPDCILPPTSRRPRFHDDEDDGDDAASVRRYRLVLPEEKNGGVETRCIEGKSRTRPGVLRRWTTFSRRG